MSDFALVAIMGLALIGSMEGIVKPYSKEWRRDSRITWGFIALGIVSALTFFIRLIITGGFHV